jgi:nucleoside-triphosphatase
MQDRQAAIANYLNSRSSVRVGKYGVDVPPFERIALPALRAAIQRKRIIVIDEIGKILVALVKSRCSDIPNP